MKKTILRSILTMALFAIVTTPAFAGQVVHMKVNGLVCDFCARSLEKVFGKQDPVSGITVDLDTKLITVTFKDGKDLDDAALTKLVTSAGYTVENIHRMDSVEADTVGADTPEKAGSNE